MLVGNGAAKKSEAFVVRAPAPDIHGQSLRCRIGGTIDGLQTLNGIHGPFILKHRGHAVQDGDQGTDIVGAKQAFVHLVLLHNAITAVHSLIRYNGNAGAQIASMSRYMVRWDTLYFSARADADRISLFSSM